LMLIQPITIGYSETYCSNEKTNVVRGRRESRFFFVDSIHHTFQNDSVK
jgi:hypothetical protein